MDIIKLTRELGAAIQQDDRYAKFQAAQKANEEDKDLNGQDPARSYVLSA